MIKLSSLIHNNGSSTAPHIGVIWSLVLWAESQGVKS
jgi:hypothetical protein